MKSLFRCSRCSRLSWASRAEERRPLPGKPATAPPRLCDPCYMEEVERFLSSWVVRRQAKLLRESAQRAQ